MGFRYFQSWAASPTRLEAPGLLLATGAALGIHPLAVLIVTIAGGALFGTVGLILAAPLTSAIVRISSDLTSARAGTAPKPGTPGPEVATAET